VSGEAGGEAAALATAAAEEGEWLESASSPIFEVPPPPESDRKLGWTLFAVLFGASAPRSRPAADPLAALREWVAEAAGRGARVYRTVPGFRVLVTAPPCDPTSDESDALLARLGAVAATRVDCRSRGVYRVRIDPPPGRAACRFVEAIGCQPAGEAARTVERHDRATRALTDLPIG
jgi:hypothetical protein